MTFNLDFVFDVMYVRGNQGQACDFVSSKIKLQDRKKVLTRVVQNIRGRVEPVPGVQSSSYDSILAAFNKAVDNKQEGIIIKQNESLYVPSLRNLSWAKLKPDYNEESVTDLDMVILGGYYAQGQKRIGNDASWLNHLSHFLIGICTSKSPVKFEPICKVGSGLTNNDLSAIRHKLSTLMMATGSAMINSEMSAWVKEYKPDLIISRPVESIVLQIRAAEITNSAGNFPYTLRFPRVESVRFDKPAQECCSVQELLQVMNSQRSKLKRHGDIDISDPEDAKASDKKKRKSRKNNSAKKPVTFSKTKGTVMQQFQEINLGSNFIRNLEKDGQRQKVFQGYEIVVLNYGGEYTKDQIEPLIVSNGGKRVQNCMKSTTIAVANRPDLKCRMVNEQFGLPVLKIEWYDFNY